ncbi:AMP-binding protein [Methylobacterium oryzae]|uniref:AMP-binding protein n=1 Tax=Methylobacterium oryzae TaxID=334852 RepID=UPI003AF61D89
MSPDPRIPAGWPALPFREAEARLTASGGPFAIATIDIRGVPTRIWEKAPTTLGDLFRIARGHGDKTFVVYQDERVTFTGFARAATALARALVEAGLRKGDRVAIAQRNLPEWPVSYFGALLAGAIATPLNAWWTGPELAYGLRHSGARVLIADGERFARIAPHLPECPALERVFTTRMEADPRATPLADLLGPVADWAALPDLPLPDIALDPEDDATLFYTSGTTGHPKGAVGTHRAAATTVMAYPYSAARSALRRGEAPPKPDPRGAASRRSRSIPPAGCRPRPSWSRPARPSRPGVPRPTGPRASRSSSRAFRSAPGNGTGASREAFVVAASFPKAGDRFPGRCAKEIACPTPRSSTRSRTSPTGRIPIRSTRSCGRTRSRARTTARRPEPGWRRPTAPSRASCRTRGSAPKPCPRPTGRAPATPSPT